MKDYILDACALLAFFREEKGAELIQELLLKAKQGEVRLFMHLMNLGEVYYDIYRSHGEEGANQAYVLARNFPVEYIDISEEILLTSGRIKGSYKVAYADTYALALCLLKKATLVTADHHELEVVVQRESIETFWIR